MTFEGLIQNYEDRFDPNGEFNLLPNESINIVVNQHNIPEERGVYLIYDNLGCTGNIIYIGRSGTINQDGNWRNQGLKTRLTRIQGGLPRWIFFQNLIQEHYPTGISFKYFITFNNTNNILPMFAEAELLQAFFNENNLLPKLNKNC